MRAKRNSLVPQSITGWSVLLVGVLCATGVVVLYLGERDIAIGIFSGAGWSGYIMNMFRRK